MLKTKQKKLKMKQWSSMCQMKKWPEGNCYLGSAVELSLEPTASIGTQSGGLPAFEGSTQHVGLPGVAGQCSHLSQAGS